MSKKSEKNKNSMVNHAIVDLRRPRRDAQVVLDLIEQGGKVNKGRLSPQEYEEVKKSGTCPHLY